MRVHFAFGCVAPALLGPVAVAGPCVCGSVCLVRFVLLGLCSVCVFDCRLLRWDMTQSFSPMGGWVGGHCPVALRVCVPFQRATLCRGIQNKNKITSACFLCVLP